MEDRTRAVRMTAQRYNHCASYSAPNLDVKSAQCRLVWGKSIFRENVCCKYFLFFISFIFLQIKSSLMGPCKVRNETETKRNETDRNETKQIETKRNKKRNETNRNETNDMASHCRQKSVFPNIRKLFFIFRKWFSNITNPFSNITHPLSNIRNSFSNIRK